MNRSHQIASPGDLVTPYEEIRAGFLRLALEKNRLATPYVQEAKALRIIASRVSVPSELVAVKEIRPSLLTAAGVSDKALHHLTNDVGDALIAKLIETFLEPAGKDFVDELVFRFLLTRGDSLGGRMRNLGGQLAQQQFVRALIATLSIQNKPFQWLDKKTNLWIAAARDDLDIEPQTKGLHWNIGEAHRTLLLNVTIPGIRKNVDVCLLNTPYTAVTKRRKPGFPQSDPALYIALGELKGGIDPAGADEHWKTAVSALSRIRSSFEKDGYRPHLFLIAAAIAKAMAEEIFDQLEDGSLAYAANLTNEEQLFALCDWVANL